MSDLVPRHKMLAFYGVPSSSTAGYVLTRMQFFTELGLSKNPVEHSRKYVDEATERTDVVAFAPSIAYAFDKHRDNAVLTDIVGITDGEKLGSDAVRVIVWVDTHTGKGILREYTVIPDSEGDDANVYTYSGTFKANGEPTQVTATSSDDWMTIVTTTVTSGTGG